jgi:predicted phosphodiesterase
MMRIAIISDIHGNCFALDVALADIRHAVVDQIVCLGDAIQGGAQPAATVARLRELGCPVVMGNADAWLLSGKETAAEESATEKMRAIREWSLAQLSSADRAFIAEFKPTIALALDDGHELLCFHGSPHSFDDIILPDTPEEEFRRFLGGFGASALTGGHTHLQQIRRLDDAFFFNPGSVGFAYSHQQPEEGFHADPWAEYAVLSLDSGRLGLEFRRIPYDADTLIEIILRSGRPYAEEAAAQYRPTNA